MILYFIIAFILSYLTTSFITANYSARNAHNKLLNWIQYKVNKLSADCFKEVITKNSQEDIDYAIEDITKIQENSYQVFNKMSQARINIKLIINTMLTTKVNYKLFYPKDIDFAEQLPERISPTIDILRTYEAKRSGLYLGLIVSNSHDKAVRAEEIITEQIKYYEKF
jgi:hypothetical protein